MFRSCVMAMAVALGSPSAFVRAQSDPSGETGEEAAFGVDTEAERPLAARASLDPTSAGTREEVDVRTRRTSREVFESIPGVRILGTGGTQTDLGASLRGAELSHTTILLDRLPITGPDLGTFDLGEFDLRAFDAVEVYRGGAPAELGEGAIGGVIRLVPRASGADQVGASLSYGAFHQTRLSGWTALSTDNGLRWHALLSVDGADNGYPYLDDGNTRFDPGDDRERQRDNADTFGANSLMHLSVPVGAGTLAAVVLARTRRGGLPGAASRPAFHARRWFSHYVGSLSYRIEGDVEGQRLRLEVLGGGYYAQRRVYDRVSELGRGRLDTDDRQHRLFGRLLGAWTPLRGFTLGALVTARRDAFEPEDNFATRPIDDSERATWATVVYGELDPRVDNVRIAIRPSVRFEHSVATLSAPESFRPNEVDAEVLAPTLRLGVGISPLSWLLVSASVAHGTRLPSILELFGNRSTLLPSLDLNPERATTVDGGVVLREAFERGRVQLSAELRAFVSIVDDLIRYQRTAQLTAIALNVASAQISGAEAGLAMRAPHVRFRGAATWLDPRDHLGRQLPFRPSWQAYGRLQLSTDDWWGNDVLLNLYAQVQYTDASYVDLANLVQLPGRAWVSAGARLGLFGDRLGIAFDLRDLGNEAGQDFLGYPLPGRRWSVQIDFMENER